MLDTANEKSTSTIAKIKTLQEEIARLSVQAKEDALSQATEAIEMLNALGFPYKLLDERVKGRTPSKRRTAKSGPCNICEFATEPHHDARKHKFQGDEKRPFTDEELAQLELRKVT